MAAKKKKPAAALGDDPLSWMNADDEARHIQPDHDGNNSVIRSEADVPVTALDPEEGEPVPTSIVLEPVITLAEVAQLRKTLQGYLGAPQVEIDISRVEHVDTAGLQLLLSFLNVREKQGGKTVWLGRSGFCLETADLLGLTRALGLKG